MLCLQLVCSEKQKVKVELYLFINNEVFRENLTFTRFTFTYYFLFCTYKLRGHIALYKNSVSV